VEKARILLVIGGGIAAYKTLELIRRGRARGLAFRCVLTRAGAEFVTPLALASLSGEKVYSDLFSLTDEVEMGHIRLSREADLILVAPATADLIAKMAGGHADDLASTLLLAADKPVLLAPAMNVRMWSHPATQRNLAQLKADGVRWIGPEAGDLACGEEGFGRMAEPEAILDALSAELGRMRGPLRGRRAVVTSGPTQEPWDPVRFLSNRSSGKQGHAIARALAAAGAQVTLVAGPVALPDPGGMEVVHVRSAREMLAAVERSLPADVLVCAAAVADWRPRSPREDKIKKQAERAPPVLALEENPDILKTIAQRREGRPRLVVGFAAETERVVERARAKLAQKGCDWLLANDVGPQSCVLGGDRNRVWWLSRDGAEEAWPELGKEEVARRLVARIADALGCAAGEA